MRSNYIYETKNRRKEHQEIIQVYMLTSLSGETECYNFYSSVDCTKYCHIVIIGDLNSQEIENKLEEIGIIGKLGLEADLILPKTQPEDSKFIIQVKKMKPKTQIASNKDFDFQIDYITAPKNFDCIKIVLLITSNTTRAIDC